MYVEFTESRELESSRSFVKSSRSISTNSGSTEETIEAVVVSPSSEATNSQAKASVPFQVLGEYAGTSFSWEWLLNLQPTLTCSESRDMVSSHA